MKDVIVVGSVPTNGSISTTPTKSDVTPSTSDHVTPSTSDHSDVDDLVPRSIHSPSISDSQTPPSSTPGSPAASGTRLPGRDSGSSSDSLEKPNKTSANSKEEDAALVVEKVPFASLDIQEQGVAKARRCAKIAQQLNKSLTGECRSLEDEMSELTKDLQALREHIKNRRGC